MLDKEDWTRLINGIAEATQSGQLGWEESAVTSQPLAATALEAVLQGWHRQVTLVAVSRSTRYELSAASEGKAPYELVVLDVSPRKTRTLGSIRSSSSVSDGMNRAVNAALEELYQTVASGIESGEDVVNRLLGDLGI
jgi:hypothetical protein